MISDSTAWLVHEIAEELKNDIPGAEEHIGDLRLKLMVFEKVREKSAELADEMAHVHRLTQAAKALRQIVELQS